jgi:hypothetical protein
MKRRILVGARNGKAVINWPVVLALGLIVGIVAGAACAGVWFLLTREFSVPALIFPVAASLGFFAGEAIRIRLLVPVEQLTRLD